MTELGVFEAGQDLRMQGDRKSKWLPAPRGGVSVMVWMPSWDAGAPSEYNARVSVSPSLLGLTWVVVGRRSSIVVVVGRGS